ncbi:geranylgeranyl reductase family protein [Halalkalicoccus salilacus]|uniref:geranylgeranyl reductase family protein n=1 Tax=Halalkalicoccus sp. GCM10025704 TaxID=3252662 RepID=UPI00361869EB
MTAREVEVDVAIVGAGTAGCYAAATIANEGYDVLVLERKSATEAGHIACGDALKGADQFPESIPRSKLDASMTNTEVDHGRFELPEHDTVLEIPVPGELAVIDRWEYGQAIIEGAAEAGAEFGYDTVVQDVIQDEGRITGVRGRRRGDPITVEAPVTIDAAGALSILQDKADLEAATFDTNVTYSQFCSAYREIVHVQEEVPWKDALVFKPTKRAAGYLWYFPRTGTEINAGVGFQMNEEPMTPADDLKRDLRSRPEFEGATVTDKLGAALPTRRPYDSAVAPGLIAAGDAAGHINPTTGGGIAGAAYAGEYAGEQAIRAIESGEPDEDALWRYNERVMDHFGARYAALDVYNVMATAVDVDDLTNLLVSLPGENLAEALYSGSTEIGWKLKLQAAVKTFGYWGTILNFYRTKRLADELLDHYERYPDRPESLAPWQRERDEIMERIYETTGAEAKY